MITGGAEHGLCVPQWMVYGFLPTAMCLGIHYAPFAYILIGGILRNMDANLEEAATVLKAGRGKILGRITLPIVAPALISTVLLVFSSSISSYTVPAFLDRDSNFPTISTQMRSVAGSPNTRGQGFVIAIILLLFSVAILSLNNWFTGKRKSFTTVSGKSGQVSLVKLGKVWRWVFAVLIIIAVVFCAIIPLVSFALESFCPGWRMDFVLLDDYGSVIRSYNGSSNGYFAQRHYMESIRLQLGTVCVRGVNSRYLRYAYRLCCIAQTRKPPCHVGGKFGVFPVSYSRA